MTDERPIINVYPEYFEIVRDIVRDISLGQETDLSAANRIAHLMPYYFKISTPKATSAMQRIVNKYVTVRNPTMFERWVIRDIAKYCSTLEEEGGG